MVEPDVQVLMFVQYDIGLYTGLLSSFLLDLRYFNLHRMHPFAGRLRQHAIKCSEECEDSWKHQSHCFPVTHVMVIVIRSWLP